MKQPQGKIIRISKKIILPGFEGLSFYDVSTFFIKGLKEGRLNTRASSVSFNFFFALFPAIIFLFTLLPHIPIENFQEVLFTIMKDIMPANSFDSTKENINEVLHLQSGEWLSIGFFLALFFATNGINGLIASFNETYHTVETRSWWKMRIVSLILTLVLAMMLFIAIILIIFSREAVNYFVEQGLVADKATLLINYGKWGIILFLLFIGISTIFYFGPTKKDRSKLFSPGSYLATFLSIVSSGGFSLYLNHFSQYNTLYGSIGVLMIILLWIWINSISLLLGFELNASIKNAKFSTQNI